MFIGAKNALYPPTYYRSAVPLKGKLTLSIAILRSNLTYTVLALITSESHVKMISPLQNKTIIIITGVPWFVRNTELQEDLQRLFFRDYFSSLARMAWDRIAISGHPVIKGLAEFQFDRRLPKLKVRRII